MTYPSISGDPKQRTSTSGTVYYIQSWRDQDNKVRQKTGATPIEAYEAAKKAVADAEQKIIEADKGPLFRDFSARFYADSLAGRNGNLPIKPTTKKFYRRFIALLDERLGDMFVTDFDDETVAETRDWLVQTSASRTTAQHGLTMLRMILRYAHQRKIIARQPGMDVLIRTDKKETAKSKRAKVPSMAEMEQLDQTVHNCAVSNDGRVRIAYQRYRPLYAILRQTGMRIGEVLGLQWGDFNESFTRVNVTRNVVDPDLVDEPEDRVSDLKTINSFRTISISPPVAEIIRVWKENAPLTRDDDWLFSTRAGEPLSYANLYRNFWKPLMKKAGLDGRGHGFHMMRHFYASMVIRDGRYKELSALLGHHSAAFTMDQYGHLIDDGGERLDEIAASVMKGFAA